VRASESRASEILAPLVAQNPAFASVVVGETVRQYGADNTTDVGTWEEAGRALLVAEETWVRGLGPLAELVAPMDDQGALLPLGINTDDGRLTTAWYWGLERREELFRLDSSFFPIGAPVGYGPSRSGRPPGGSGWPWRWTRDQLAGTLGQLLNERRLVLAGTPLEHEAVWTVALRALEHGSLTPEPIDVKELLDLSPATDALITSMGRIVELGGLRDALMRHVDGQGFLAPPWPGPDRSTPGSWVWSDFSAERVRVRAEAIYAAALQTYEYFSTELLAELASRMRVAVTLPAVARGTVFFSDRPDFSGAPLLDWALIPLVSGPTRVEFQLGTRRTVDDLLADTDQALKATRPDAARWIRGVAHGGVLDIFQPAPATQLTYKWLWDDLQPLGWTSGSFSPGRSDDHLPRLK
jgi:hypothetical protein